MRLLKSQNCSPNRSTETQGIPKKPSDLKPFGLANNFNKFSLRDFEMSLAKYTEQKAKGLSQTLKLYKGSST